MARARPLALLSLLGVVGCAYISDEDEKWRLDPDGDGAPIGQDCDDNDASATDPVTFFTDADGDGFGDPDTQQTACTFPAGAADNGDDCDDTDEDVFPDAPDAWYDGVDSDCAGDDDFDQDGDGYGVEVDCDDTDASLAPDPGVAETWFNGVDDNCDITDQDGDQDGDGYWAADYAARVAANDASPLPIPDGKAGDCWDDPSATPEEQEVVSGAVALTADQVNPGAAETFYDGADQDCEGEDADGNGVDDDFDQDGDGQASLDHPDASGAVGTDCDDTDANAYRGADEIWYDGVDQSCKGTSDYDADGDLYDSDAHGGLDCDDEDPSVYPDAYDTWYDNVDSDCSGGSDFDADADGEDAADWAAGGTDCDDTDPTINAAATEVWYDGVDQDCDGASDYDADRDGYDSEVALAGGGDCDDAEPLANPGETEVCGDGFDNDCDGLGIDPTTGEACWIEGEQSTEAADGHVYGSTSAQYLGSALATGDMDGDGRGDIVVGARDDDTSGANAGGVWVLRGSDIATGRVRADATPLQIYGRTAYDYLGAAVALTDLDGDGSDDLVMGASGVDDGASSGGATYVYYGSMSGFATVTGIADAQLNGAQAYGNLGSALAGIGDQDGDGKDDLLVGEPNSSVGGSYSGAVVVVTGAPSGTASAAGYSYVYDTTDNSSFGQAVASGDVTGDGVDDLLVGSPYYRYGSLSGAGAAFLFEGPVTTATSSSAATRFHGEAEWLETGRGVAVAEDFNDDGYADIVVGQPAYYDAASEQYGRVFVLFGPQTASGALATLADATVNPTPDTSASSSYAYCGWSVDASGDADGDGVSDLLVGCPYESASGNTYAGSTYLFYGGVSGTASTGDATARVYGTASQEQVGRAALFVPDVDTDGYDEVLIGGHQWSNGSTTYAGRASLFLGGSW